MKRIARLLMLALWPLAAAAGDSPMNVIGRADAPVMVVEFSDLECPHCAKYERDTFPEIRRLYVDTGQVLYVAMDFPLPMHKNAMPAAVAARCAGLQDRFWAYRAAVFDDQARLGQPSFLTDVAKKLGLDLRKFEDCRKDPSTQAAVLESFEAARKYRLTSTPSFMIGRLVGEEFVAEPLEGAQPLAEFQRVIDAALASGD